MSDQRLYHTVANKILEMIDSGVFPPGSRLPGERELAKRFEVSRVSIREAEIALQAQGRVEIKVGSGVYVLDQTNLPIYGLPKVGPFELTEARCLYEGEAAALAATMITDQDLDRLEHLIDVMNETVEDELTREEADEEFHLIIARATKNHAILFVVDSLWKMRTEAAQLQKVYAEACARENSNRDDEHQAILDALRRRDSGAARAAMRAHFSSLINVLLKDSEEQAYKELQRQVSESRSRYMMSQQLL
jgi:DNA-binding FadR family transcriptional regulator